MLSILGKEVWAVYEAICVGEEESSFRFWSFKKCVNGTSNDKCRDSMYHGVFNLVYYRMKLYFDK